MSLIPYRRRRDGQIIYWTKFRFEKRTYLRKLGPISRKAAEQAETLAKGQAWAHAWPEDRLIPPPLPPPVIPTLTAFAEGWFLPWYQSGHRPRSLDTTRDRLRLHLCRYMGGYTLDELTTGRIDDYRTARVHDGMHRRTINGELSTLRHLLSKARERAPDNGWVLPSVKVHCFPETETELRILTETEESQLLLAATPRLQPLIRFALHTGLRRNELLTLTWQQIDWARREVVVTSERAKSHKSRRIPLNTTALEVLLSFPAHNMREKVQHRVFGYRIIDTTFSKAKHKAGLPWVSPHTLRRTFATRLLQQGVNVRTVQKWLGHADLTTTMKYLQPLPAYEREGIESLVEANHSLARHAEPSRS
jgi:integrase